MLIDGQVKARIDLFSPDTQWQRQTVFDGLEPGPHIIEVRVTEQRNPASVDYFIDLDRLSAIKTENRQTEFVCP